jgi:hypothetical protein
MPTASSISSLLDREIAGLESRLSALRAARVALGGNIRGSRPGGGSPAVPNGRSKRVGRRKGFKVSASTRAKLRAAWAKRKKNAGVATRVTTRRVQKRRTMSAAARAKISAAQKARWAKLKKA